MKTKIIRPVLLAIFTFCFSVAFGQAYAIYTITGNGKPGFTGDNGIDTAAKIFSPNGIAADAIGNMYFADVGNNRIRKINYAGIITTIAGDSTEGFFGDFGAATAAELYNPEGISLDDSSNIYIADYMNNRIRKVSYNGIITTIAGNGSKGFFGDSGAATAAELNLPWSTAIDHAGNIYIADAGNNRIRKVSTSGIITTIAGNGINSFNGDNGPATAAELYGPAGLALDGSGNLYFADENNNRIRKVSTSGIITTVAGNGSKGFSGDSVAATATRLYLPTGIAIDVNGVLYIADQVNNRIRKVNKGGIITTIAGNGTAGFFGDSGMATAAELDDPTEITLDAHGNIYIADEGNQRIRKLTQEPTGINEITVSNENVVIYPDPNKGAFTVLVKQISSKPIIEIYNSMGEKLYQSVLNTNSTEVNMSNHMPGIYLYRLITEDGRNIQTGKFIIQ